jgi:hypothetical protein
MVNRDELKLVPTPGEVKIPVIVSLFQKPRIHDVFIKLAVLHFCLLCIHTPGKRALRSAQPIICCAVQESDAEEDPSVCHGF